MVDPTASVTAEDLRKVAWPEVIAGLAEKECHEYMTAFIRKMNEAETSEAQTEYSVYRLLAQLTSLYLHHESATEPYGPLTIFGGSRSAIPDDFSEKQLMVLEEIVFTIQDAEMRARIADVVWLRLRNYKAAILAVDSYLETATNLEHPENWPDTYERIERALRLATTLGNGGKNAFDKVIAHIESVLDKYQAEDPLFLSHKLMELLLDFDQGDPEKYTALADKAAQLAESKNEWYRARSYFETKAKWCAKAGRKDEETAARIKAAETYVSEAATATSGLAASVHMQHAVEAYRRIGGQQQRSDDLYQKLLAYQQKSLTEMSPISTQLDASGEIERARNAVAGQPLHEAVMTLCLLVKPTRVDGLRRQIEELAKKHPMQFLFPTSILNSDGNVVAQLPNLLAGNEEEKEKAYRAHMFHQTGLNYSVDVQVAIEPARRQILLEHNIALSDLAPFVSNNPLVRPGREYLYAEGLRAGLVGDWVTAAHLLIPQFEDSMRYLLHKAGVTTSGMDKEGVQDERSLNVTLYLPELEKMLGPDITFDLQSLLVEGYGHNLRNNLAHGLMSYGAFYSHSVIYLWWLVLRLICWPATVAMVKNKSAGNAVNRDKVTQQENDA